MREGKDDAACACIDELMAAVDDYVPVPERAVDLPFLMPLKTFSALRVAVQLVPAVLSVVLSMLGTKLRSLVWLIKFARQR